MKLPYFFVFLFLGSRLFAQQPSTPHQSTSSSKSKYGETIFSRSATNEAAPQNQQATAQPTPSSSVSLISDAERAALIYSSYNFEIHLDPPRRSISVHALLTARNDSTEPISQIALQLSSALHWYSIHVDGKPMKHQTESIESDIDHTGQLTEAVVQLASPLAPGATIHLEVIYSGTIQQSSERLLRLGAPEKIAATSEWDRIGTGFTALRGFGNVIWFPVSTVPVLLGQGAQLFDTVGKWKLRQQEAQVQMRVFVEYLHAKPNIAFLNGNVVKPDISSPEKSASTPANSVPLASLQNTATNDIPRVVSFSLAPMKLGFSPLSMFVADASQQHFPGLDIYSRHGNEQSATNYEKVIEAARPLVEQWLGSQHRRPVVLVDLPESDDLPFEDHNILLIPIQANATNDNAGPVMAHMLSHAYFLSSRPWLSEGVAQWMTLLWIEQRAGRATAVQQMESTRAALALAETSDPGVNPGQSLISAWSDIFYRDKAADVMWMLRDIAGDTPLAKALQTYEPASDDEPSYFQRLLQKTSGKDLEWFFDDWVYRDHGLPDLHIASAYRRPILTKNSAIKNYLVSIDVQNDSFCSAEVPVTVESALTTQTKRLRVPSHTRAALRVLLDSEPVRVTVNDGSVPEVQTSQHQKAITPAQ